MWVGLAGVVRRRGRGVLGGRGGGWGVVPSGSVGVESWAEEAVAGGGAGGAVVRSGPHPGLRSPAVVGVDGRQAWRVSKALGFPTGPVSAVLAARTERHGPAAARR